ncbi:MAG: DUF3604 domain-containing protein, partial [Vulcanimicrobiaceae bacterium]
MTFSSYLQKRVGSARIEPQGRFEAGSYASFALTYTAGYFGIDDTGSLKIVMRFATDTGRLQFTDPAAPNYVSVEASNGALLDARYEHKLNVRPWDKTIFIRIRRGFLREGDTITIRLGDRRGGSPGWRMQTFVESTFELKVLVDAFATYTFVELPESPTIAIVPGAPALWKAVLPTMRRVGETFSLGIKAEDRWGNPSDRAAQQLRLRSTGTIRGLPQHFAFESGKFSARIEGLSIDAAGDYIVDLMNEDGKVLCSSNPLRVVENATLLPYWGDLHGQSEESIGTNSARDYHIFARDLAFLDAISHQANDFQVTTPLWNLVNE